jgi:hypothetical protein
MFESNGLLECSFCVGTLKLEVPLSVKEKRKKMKACLLGRTREHLLLVLGLIPFLFVKYELSNPRSNYGRHGSY